MGTPSVNQCLRLLFLPDQWSEFVNNTLHLCIIFAEIIANQFRSDASTVFKVRAGAHR